MILLNSTDSLQVLLAGTVTTNQCVLYAAFADMATDGSTFAPGAANGLTNNTTAVSWLAAPAVDTVRQAKYLSLYNADTVSITATVRINDGTNTRILCKVTLATGERLEYSVDGGFRTVSASGSSAAVTSVNGLTGAVVLGGEAIAEPVNALSISSGVVNIDCATGDYFTLSLSANVTSITFSNLPASGKAQTLMVRIQQNASSAKTVAFPSAFKWAGGVTGVVSTALSAYDNLAVTTYDQGTRWEATLAKAFA